MPRVGYIWIGARGTDVSNAGLRQGLIDLGYFLGRNLILEERYANGNPERVPGLIAELLRSPQSVAYRRSMCLVTRSSEEG